VAPPLADVHLGVLAGAGIACHRVAQLRPVASALAQTEEARPVVGRDIDRAVALQEGAVGGVVDDAAVGAAPVGLEQLRVIVASLEEVPALPVADLVKRGPALQEELQVVCALALGQAEFLAGVAVEEAAQTPGAVEVGGREADLHEARSVVTDSQEPLRLHHGAVVATVDFQAAGSVEIRQLRIITVHLQVTSKSRRFRAGDATLPGGSLLLAPPRWVLHTLPHVDPALRDPEPPSSGRTRLFPCIFPHTHRTRFQGNDWNNGAATTTLRAPKGPPRSGGPRGLPPSATQYSRGPTSGSGPGPRTFQPSSKGTSDHRASHRLPPQGGPPRRQHLYLDLRRAGTSDLHLLADDLDPHDTRPVGSRSGLLLADVHLHEVRPLRAGFEQRVGVLQRIGEGNAVKRLQHLALPHHTQALPLRIAAPVAVLNGAGLSCGAAGVKAPGLPAVLALALHRAVRCRPERLPDGVIPAVHVAAALADGHAAVRAEDVALVALAALGARGGAGQRGREVRTRGGAAAGAHRVVAALRAPHGRRCGHGGETNKRRTALRYGSGSITSFPWTRDRDDAA